MQFFISSIDIGSALSKACKYDADGDADDDADDNAEGDAEGW